MCEQSVSNAVKRSDMTYKTDYFISKCKFCFYQKKQKTYIASVNQKQNCKNVLI